MGCCISKCRPDPKHSLQLQHQFNRHQIQDKLVISRTPPPPPTTTLYPSSKHKITPSPPSPTSSSTSSSLSSFTRTTTTSHTISSSASSFSSASSSSALTSSKFDKSFSNEFLWSCYKENPHIARINSLKDASLSLTPRHHRNIINPSNINPSPPKPSKHYSPPQNGLFSSMPQKRVRSNSPTNLTRQKSLRKEPPVGPIFVNSSASNMNMSTSRTTLGSSSPSPSRRFIGDKCGNPLGTTSFNMKKDQGLKSASNLNSNSRRFLHAGLRHRETCNFRVGSKIDETVVKDVMSSNDEVDTTMMEDIDNPLISLDCFIFL